MKTKISLARFFTAGMVLLLFFLSLNNLFQQRLYFNNLLNETNRLKLRRLIRVLAAKSQPENLLRNLVFSRLREIGEISEENIPALQSSLISCLDDQAQMIFMDSKFKTVLSKNLNDEQKIIHQNFLNYFLKHSQRSFSDEDKKKARQIAKEAFQLSILVQHFPNLQNSGLAKHFGRTGMLFIGMIPAKLQKKALRQVSIGLANPRELKKSNNGLYLIFVPETTFNNESWYRRSIQQAKWNYDYSPIVGTAEEIEEILTATAGKKAAEIFSKSIASGPSGAFILHNQGFSFTQAGLHSGRKLFILQQQHLPKLPVFLTEKIALIFQTIAVLFLLFLIFKLSQENFSWNDGIKTKFLLISSFAAIFPLTGVLFQESSRSSLNHFIKENKIFSQLEERFSQIENEIDVKLSDVFDCMDISKNTYRENASTNRIKFLQDLRQIRKRRIYHFIVCEPGGKVTLMDTDTGNDQRMSVSLKKILNGLANFSIKNLNLQQLRNPNQDKNLHNSLVLETLTEGFPKEHLYRNSLILRNLKPFKLGRESIWIFSDFFYDKSSNPDKYCFMIIDRNRIVREIVDHYQRRLSLNYPEMLFFIKLGSYSTIAPIWGEDKAELITLMEVAGTEGETIRQSVSLENKKLYLFGRRLKGQEWAALSIHYEDLKQGFNHSISLTAVFGIAYVILVLLILTAYFQQFFSRPVNQIRNAVTEMSNGNYKLKLSVESQDELGQLSLSFNQMATELEEKEYLSRFLSDLAREAISGTRSISGTKINGTILFSDIRDFTTLTEKHSAEDIVEMLNDYMTAMESLIEKHHGSIEKYIGDAVMAVFLPELGQVAPAQRAAQAALEMGEALTEFNRQRVAKQQFPVKNGVGIATGELLMGSMGNLQGQQRYTVTGATVNLAAEMEKLSKNTGALPIVLCARTAAEVKIYDHGLQKLESPGKKSAYTFSVTRI